MFLWAFLCLDVLVFYDLLLLPLFVLSVGSERGLTNNDLVVREVAMPLLVLSVSSVRGLTNNDVYFAKLLLQPAHARPFEHRQRQSV